MKMTTVKPLSTAPHHQQADYTVTNTTSLPHAVTSPVASERSPSSPVSTTPSPKPPSSSPPPTSEHRKPPYAGRKHLTLSADEARSRLLWSTAGVKGAIVALTLGIIVTVLTLAYIACLYRHQRKLARRHRHLSAGSNDADYLVNGMYL